MDCLTLAHKGWDKGATLQKGVCDQLTPFGLLRKLVSDEDVERHLLTHINASMRSQKESCKLSGSGRGKRSGKTDIPGFWLYTLYSLIKGALSAGRSPNDAARLANFRPPFGEHKMKDLGHGFCMPKTDIRKFAASVCSNTRSLVNLGNYLTVDETLIEYYGKSMLLLHEDIYIPHKPHDFGLLMHGAMMETEHSKLPIFVGLEMRLHGHKLTPSDALFQLVEMLCSSSGQKFHVYADSGFSLKCLAPKLLDLGCTYTFSIGRNGWKKIANLVKDRLLSDESFTMSDHLHVIQCHQTEEHMTMVASSHWHSTITIQSHLKPRLSAAKMTYKAAADFVQAGVDNKSLSFLGQALNLPPSSMEDPIDVGYALCGSDISIPEPLPDGTVPTSAAAWNTLTKFQLQLHMKIHYPDQGAKTKDAIKQFLLSSADSNTIQKVPLGPDEKSLEIERVTLEDNMRIMRGEASNDASIVSRYNQHYGLEDRADRAFYNLFKPKVAKIEEKLLILSIVTMGIINAHALWKESLEMHMPTRSAPTNAQKKSRTLVQFLIEIYEEAQTTLMYNK